MTSELTTPQGKEQAVQSAGEGWWLRWLRWRQEHVPDKTFVALLALVIGVASGLAAVLLKWLIATISSFLISRFDAAQGNVLYLLLPMVGILITSCYVYYVVRDPISHGVTRVLYALALKKSRLKRHNMYASVAASSVTIGFGGSVGAEGPIVFTGAAIGSNLGLAFRLAPNVLAMLVGCGAAAGIAGIYKAPIAGLLFTIEVLMLDLSAGSAIPLIIASVAGATVSYVFTGYNVEFFFSQSEPFYASRIPFVVMLGVFCGFVSLYFIYVIGWLEGVFKRMSNRWVRVVVGGSLLGLLIFLLPPLYGEGYGDVTHLLNNNVSEIFDNSIFYAYRDQTWMVLTFVGSLMLVKVIATAATNGGGGVGGTFAPSLFVGSMAGFFFAYLLNHSGLLATPLSIKNFTLMGMAGVMAGVMHAPLMGIFLTAEMTGGYDLFLPLLIVSVMSYATSRMVTPYGIYSRRLARRGELLTHQKDHAVLTLLKLHSVIETDFIAVHPEMSLKDMVDVISQSKRNMYPVTDGEGRLVGVVQLNDIRNIMFRPDLYRRMQVNRFMTMPEHTVLMDTPMEKVMKIFDETGAWNLPVVDQDGKYMGFVSKSKIFNSYRQVLKHYTYD